MAKATLYVIPGSHPALTARLMLDRKSIPFKRVDLMPVISKGVLKALRFDGITRACAEDRRQAHPGLARDRARLDRVRPEPPLFPSDPDARAKVEEAERWGDEVFQGRPRHIIWWALRRSRAPLASYSEGARLGVPVGLAVKTGAPIVAAAAKLNHATDENVRADLAALPRTSTA